MIVWINIALNFLNLMIREEQLDISIGEHFVYIEILLKICTLVIIIIIKITKKNIYKLINHNTENKANQ